MAASLGVLRRWIMDKVSEDTSEEDNEWTEEEVLTRSDLLPLLVALPLPIFAFSSSQPLYAMLKGIRNHSRSHRITITFFFPNRKFSLSPDVVD